MHPLEPTTTTYDVSRFKTLFVVEDAHKDYDEDEDEEGFVTEDEDDDGGHLICQAAQEMYDEELALEREEQEFEERNLGSLECPEGLQLFNCRSCSERFSSRTELTAHRRHLHLAENRKRKRKPASELTCETCGKVFQRHNALVDHMNSHKDQRNFECPECPARFVQRSNRDRHVRDTHLKEYGHPCPEPGCGRRFQQRRERDQHVKTVHRKERDLVCSTCQATFSHPVNYRKHLASHSSIKPFGCPICKKLFGRQENRDVHLFVHSVCKAYVCSVCGAGYMRRQQLIRHSAASGHVNDKIVRQKPQFSAAFARHQDDANVDDFFRQEDSPEEEDEEEQMELMKGVGKLIGDENED